MNIILFLTALTVSQTTAFKKYKFEALAPQKWIKLAENPFVSADIRPQEDGTPGDVFLIFNQPIDRKDNYRLRYVYTGPEGDRYPETDRGMNLCDQLELEHGETLEPFTHSNMFGLTGLRCPINAGDVRNSINVIPFEYPQYHEYHLDIGCGTHQYEVALLKCEKSDPLDCVELIRGGIKSKWVGDHCSEDEGISEMPAVYEGGIPLQF